ncbi:MAG: hypothetical protein UV09_C0001G0024 [Candidatus Gottesmanbacteria bacterium GW2011_GWA2_42_18]|uniref:Uncharacterized protein n=1 Tax=Candidatus Gottesmanbacteria bacterium GW2011_GWA2_42_18 TaxID=1618442 RepID=A0A0G0ZH06_9BACT|nr:MAG: hypothetical protein UV09_C0001G0024 [Candidatus Gottesmanbacteria bacterium GW2011_GWA2_42_18]KKS73486.1 MAG: hypothetical protein UV46_C0073G0009 [Candidatus Gottesmanbacteria bacterium GW2011_GWC2_42_8]
MCIQSVCVESIHFSIKSFYFRNKNMRVGICAVCEYYCGLVVHKC